MVYLDETKPTLYTKRLTLTSLSLDDPEDIDFVVASFEDPVLVQNLGDCGVHTPADATALLVSTTLSPSARSIKSLPGPTIFILRDGANSPDSKRIGLVTLVQRGSKVIPDMGWSMLAPYTGKGYITEAGTEALRFWRDELGVRNIIVPTHTHNRGSYRIAEKLGFVRVEQGMRTNDGDGETMNLYILPGMELPPEDAVFSFRPVEE